MKLFSVGTYLLKILWADAFENIQSCRRQIFTYKVDLTSTHVLSRFCICDSLIPIHELSLCIPYSLEY